MISYFCNRHYHTMTQLLPPSLRQNQPEYVYYKTFVNEDSLALLHHNQKITHRTLAASNKKIHTKKSSKKPNHKHTDKDMCPICMEQHIAVEYYGHRHICTKCRNFVRDEHGNQVKIFVNEKGEIVCLGIYPK